MELEERLAQHMQRRVIYRDADMLVLDKPAGLPTQGGDGISISVDSLLPYLHHGNSDALRQAYLKQL